jgi:cation diffusion facilitator family transporter
MSTKIYAPKVSKRPIAIYGAIAANFAVAFIKFVASAFTGSSAMLSEGIHSLVDTGNEALLILGLRLSSRPPDDAHPYGYGKELYFWSLIVAVLLFGTGGGMAFYEGISHLRNPTPIENAKWNYIVLGCSFIFEGSSFFIARKEFPRSLKRRGFLRGIHSSKDPSVFTVLMEDAAALVGLAIAALGVFVGETFQIPEADGIASLLIGLTLAFVAVFLAYECRGLLIGESASHEIVSNAWAIASSDAAVIEVERPLTMQLSPDEILMNLKIRFCKDLARADIADSLQRIQNKIQKNHPQVRQLFIAATSLERTNELPN